MLLTLTAAVLLSQSQPVLTLEEAFRQAEAQNQDLLAARARLTQADEISRRAWAGYLPQLTANGTYTYNSAEASISLPTSYYIRDVGQPQGPVFDPTREPGLDNPPGAQTSLIQVPAEFIEAEIQPKHALSGTVQLSQAIIAPQLWSAIRNANLSERASQLSVENARREILFATAQLYYGAEGLREAMEVQERLLSVNRAREADAEVRFRVGTSTKVALLRAQIERARAEQDLQRTRNAYRGAKIALATMLAREADFEVARPAAPPAPPGTEALLAAARSRPDVEAARTNLELAEGNRTQVLLGYAPSIGAFGRYQLSNARGFTGEYGLMTVGAQLSWTLWDGGVRESQLREASARIVENRHTVQGLELRAREAVNRALLDLESARTNVTTAVEQQKLARESADLVNASYQAGAATYLEVVDANAALTQAELNAINEELNVQLAVLKVAHAAGLFDPIRSNPQ